MRPTATQGPSRHPVTHLRCRLAWRRSRVILCRLPAIAREQGHDEILQAIGIDDSTGFRPGEASSVNGGKEELRRRLHGVEENVSSVVARIDHVMDIDPRSRSNQPDFVSKFGGFHPPGQTRLLESLAFGDGVRADFLILLCRKSRCGRCPARSPSSASHTHQAHGAPFSPLLPRSGNAIFSTPSPGFDPRDLESETIEAFLQPDPLNSPTPASNQSSPSSPR